MSDKNRKKEVLKLVREKIGKLPAGFIAGAAIGGALYFYSTKKTSKRGKETGAILKLAKLAAPYVIIAFLEKMADSYDKQSEPKEVIDVEAEEV